MRKYIPSSPVYAGEAARLVRADAVRDTVTIRASVPRYTVAADAGRGLFVRAFAAAFVFILVLQLI
jgi:hypothetical protein